jgi:hypothetical protein
MKSPLTTSRTSGNRKISAVPVVLSRSLGAKRSGFGRGRLVRCGLVLKAALIADAEDGGVIRVISEYEVSK